jgi:hypothetical protein
MPTISAFYGILIRMFFNDHAPPHFHARYGDFEATLDLASLEVIQDQLPRRALNLVQEWAMIHREECLKIGASVAKMRRRQRLSRSRKRSFFHVLERR